MEEKTRKALLISLIFLIVIILGVILWYPRGNSVVLEDTSKYIDQIDSLQREIDRVNSLKDSIDHKIDTVTIRIIENKVQYEKDRNTILNNTTSEDYVFFTEYVRANRARLDSINHP